MNHKALDTWVNDRKNATGHPKALLSRIGADGETGTSGDGRRHLDTPTADNIIRLVNRSGIAGAPGRKHLVDRIRYHLGYLQGAPVASSAALAGHEVRFIEQRARDLLDQYADEMNVTIVNPRPT